MFTNTTVTVNKSALVVDRIIGLFIDLRLTDGTIVNMSIEDAMREGLLNSNNANVKPFVLESVQQPQIEVKPNVNPPAVKPSGTRPMTKDEMKDALKAAGYKGTRGWWFSVEKMTQAMKEMGLSPYTNGEPQQQSSNPPAHNGNNGKPQGGRRKDDDDGFKFEEENHNIAEEKLVKVKVLTSKGKVMEVYKLRDLDDGAIRVWNPDTKKQKAGLAEGFKSGGAWGVPSHRIVK